MKLNWIMVQYGFTVESLAQSIESPNHEVLCVYPKAIEAMANFSLFI